MFQGTAQWKRSLSTGSELRRVRDGAPAGVDGDRNTAIAMPSKIHVARAHNKRGEAYANVVTRSGFHEIVAIAQIVVNR